MRPSQGASFTAGALSLPVPKGRGHHGSFSHKVQNKPEGVGVRGEALGLLFERSLFWMHWLIKFKDRGKKITRTHASLRDCESSFEKPFISTFPQGVGWRGEDARGSFSVGLKMMAEFGSNCPVLKHGSRSLSCLRVEQVFHEASFFSPHNKNEAGGGGFRVTRNRALFSSLPEVG